MLLVEDEAEVIAVISRMLRARGYEVDTAGNGDTALELLTNGTGYDILVPDIVMPGSLQGSALAQAMRVAGQNLPVVLLSGHANKTQFGEGIREQDVRPTKPVSRAELLDALSEVLERGARTTL